jgi:TnpA family transposase
LEKPKRQCFSAITLLRERFNGRFTGLNVVENWNATDDFICYGRQGELATNSREQQEMVTLSLQLLQNCLVLIKTLLVERTMSASGCGKLTAEKIFGR